jgi:hypothetical protein
VCEVLRQIFCHRRSLDRDCQNRYSAMAAFYTMFHAPASTTMEEIFIRASSADRTPAADGRRRIQICTRAQAAAIQIQLGTLENSISLLKSSKTLTNNPAHIKCELQILLPITLGGGLCIGPLRGPENGQAI